MKKTTSKITTTFLNLYQEYSTEGCFVYFSHASHSSFMPKVYAWLKPVIAFIKASTSCSFHLRLGQRFPPWTPSSTRRDSMISSLPFCPSPGQLSSVHGDEEGRQQRGVETLTHPLCHRGGTPTAATTTIRLHFDFHLFVFLFCGTMRVMEMDNSSNFFGGAFYCFLVHDIWYFSCLLKRKRTERGKRLS